MASSTLSTSTLSTQEQLESIWSLGGLTLRQLLKRVWDGINENDLFGLASELAYAFILSIFPGLMFLLSLFGLLASRGTMLRDSLMSYIATALPPSAYQVVTRTIAEVTQNTGKGKITFSILLALLSASGGMVSMISGLNRAYSVRDHRPWWKLRLIALLLTIAFAVLAIVALTLLLVGGHLGNFLGAHLYLGPVTVIATKVAQYLVALVLISFSFSLIYYYGPDLKEQHWYWITPGSVIGVLVWVAATAGFRLYLHYLNSYSKTYGSLGAVIILLVWFYVSGFAFLAGGEINAQIEHAAAERGHPEAKAEGEKIAPADKAKEAA